MQDTRRMQDTEYTRSWIELWLSGKLPSSVLLHSAEDLESDRMKLLWDHAIATDNSVTVIMSGKNEVAVLLERSII